MNDGPVFEAPDRGPVAPPRRKPTGDILCPVCHRTENSVRDSRPAAGNGYIRRRRDCVGCGHRFTTMEVHEIEYRRVLALAARIAEVQRLLAAADVELLRLMAGEEKT